MKGCSTAKCKSNPAFNYHRLTWKEYEYHEIGIGTNSTRNERCDVCPNVSIVANCKQQPSCIIIIVNDIKL